MSACPLCRARKGKRSCPALRAGICSICCGEKRLVEIACPRGCVYLEKGAENELARKVSDYLRHQEPQRALRWLQTVERLGFLLEAIERIAAAAPRSTEDADLQEALESARKTFDAEANGVIYESLPTSPTAQALTRELVAGVRVFKQAVDDQRAKTPERGLPRWGPAESAHCFAVLGEQCAYYVSRKDELGSFIEHLRRVHIASAATGNDGAASRIVLT